MELDLSFLGEGEYQAEIFEDGINADRVGKDYKRKLIYLPADKKLRIHMASGGGFIMKVQNKATYKFSLIIKSKEGVS